MNGVTHLTSAETDDWTMGRNCVRASFVQQSVMTGKTRGRDRMGSQEVRQTGGESQADSRGEEETDWAVRKWSNRWGWLKEGWEERWGLHFKTLAAGDGKETAWFHFYWPLHANGLGLSQFLFPGFIELGDDLFGFLSTGSVRLTSQQCLQLHNN